MTILNSPSTRYLVRLPRGWGVELKRNGVSFRRSFDITASRDEATVLKLARAWRDATLAAHPEIPRWRWTERALTGKVMSGIRYEPGPDGQLGQWNVTTPLNAKDVQVRSFSAQQYGKHQAKELAISERERALRQMIATYHAQIAVERDNQGLCNDDDRADMYGITVHAKYWRVKLEREYERFHGTFSFAKHGGRNAALRLAQAWRDEIVRAHPPVERAYRVSKPRKNTRGDIPGVFVLRDAKGKPVYYKAHMFLGGKRVQATFSVYRYGDEAEKLAIAERQRMLSQLKGLAVVHPLEERVRLARSSPQPTSS